MIVTVDLSKRYLQGAELNVVQTSSGSRKEDVKKRKKINN
jgi:hypothetical protein